MILFFALKYKRISVCFRRFFFKSISEYNLNTDGCSKDSLEHFSSKYLNVVYKTREDPNIKQLFLRKDFTSLYSDYLCLRVTVSNHPY